MDLKPDSRNITGGRLIPSEGYCDQPYVIKTDDGAWLCVMTTGRGKEGQRGQHLVAVRSTDQGRTWSDPVDVEPADGPEASYSVLLKVPGGRVYCFYNYNTDNLREVIADDPPCEDGKCQRVDSLGHFVFKYSDDGGRTWSQERCPIPVREFEIDRENPYGGEIRFGWNVGRPVVREDVAYVSFHKVGGFGEGFFTRSEGALLASDNILTESDPEKLRWETLPEGDVGLRAPADGGPIAEEQTYAVLSDGSLFSIYRTIDGHPACSYSRDGGRTWSTPEYARYADGRRIKHPRAANFVWKCSNGKFLYWFHNNGWTGYNNGPGAGSRNVAWLSGGVERDGRILWSQPEVAFYDPDFFRGPSYPDLIEDDGRYFISETQKTDARVHELDPAMLAALWGQFEDAEVAREGLVLELPANGEAMLSGADMPELAEFVTRAYWGAGPSRLDLGGGFTLDMWLRLDSLEAGQVILDSREEAGAGLALVVTSRGTLELIMNDGRGESRWDTDPGVLEAGRMQHVVAIVDGGPKIISFVIDGRLCDGGERRIYGWGRFSPVLRGVNGSKRLRVAPRMRGEIVSLRIYDRYLLTGEAVGNWKADRDQRERPAAPLASARRERV
jgi:Concanavalin A-like lectin/glucanases superfamily/BNR/Asp-box repeat